jgi:prevent-host-death family protein
MKDRTISVTEASRNFADCINKVRYQGLSYLFVKNGTPVARLVPIEEREVEEGEHIANIEGR